MPRLDQFHNWIGDMEQLMSIASASLAGNVRVSGQPALNVRLVRDYLDRGIVSRPVRRGRALEFTYRQLLELVAARLLVADGWPLAKIAENLPHMSDSEILELAQGQPKSRVGSFRGHAHEDEEDEEPGKVQVGLAMFAPSPVEVTPNQITSPARDPFSNRVKRSRAARSEFDGALRRLNIEASELRADRIALLTIASWCKVLIDQDIAEHLTIDQAEDLGRVLAGALVQLTRK